MFLSLTIFTTAFDEVGIMKKYSIKNVVLFLSLVGLQVSCATTDKPGINTQSKQKVVLTASEKKHGIQIINIRPTAANYMLDFRFRILDKNKVSEIMSRKIKPLLIVERNGATLMVPVTSKLGPLRQSAKFAKENKNYFMFFANPSHIVKSGDLVTIKIGDFKKEHIVVL